MPDYRVNLDVYNGPLDLLLYLIRRDEVDIHDIPIARVTEQYMAWVEMLRTLDPNLAGEFLVMAATLMEIKTRMLLPAPEIEADDAEDYAIDPRADLVRQLLQYKAFKDAAGDLADRAELQAMKFPRKPALPDQASEPELDLDDVQIWDLFDAFRGVMESIGQRPTHHEVIYDDTPVELYETDIVDRLEREGPLQFADIFAGRDSHAEVVGLFLAMLELIKQQRIWAKQDRNFGEIFIELNPDPPSEEELEAAEEAAAKARAAAGGSDFDGPTEADPNAILVTEDDLTEESDEPLPGPDDLPDSDTTPPENETEAPDESTDQPEPETR